MCSCTGTVDPCKETCDKCSTTTECDQHTEVLASYFLCYEISPCNDGCAETTGTDCVTVSKDTSLFLKGQSLTSVITTLEGMLQALAADYNMNNSPQLIRFRFKPAQYPVTAVINRNAVEVLNAEYADANALLTALQGVDSTWSLDSEVFGVRGTADWTWALTY